MPGHPNNILSKILYSCRACNSLSSFRSSTSGIVAATATDAAAASSSTKDPRADCPPDVEALGRSSWTLLHSIAAQYPPNPTPNDQSNLTSFIGLFSKLYPCWVCAEDFQDYISKVGGVKARSRDEFGRWLCEAHNDVNEKLGKPKFDCCKWEERWRTGWKDGRCD